MMRPTATLLRAGGNAHPLPCPGSAIAWRGPRSPTSTFGTVVSLNAGSWGTSGLTTSPWEALVVECDSMQPVWCRQS
jgi:hypothetical protein